MNISATVEAMRTIVDAYDKFEAKKLKIKMKKEKLLKGGKSMKFGTVIGIVVGALTLIAAGAAAACVFMKKGCCCDDCCCKDDDLFDEFTEEDCCCDKPVPEASEEEQKDSEF